MFRGLVLVISLGCSIRVQGLRGLALKGSVGVAIRLLCGVGFLFSLVLLGMIL